MKNTLKFRNQLKGFDQAENYNLATKNEGYIQKIL